MILGEQREAVIANIAACAEKGSFHSKVELNDPVLTPKQSAAVTERYLKKRKTPSYWIKTQIARQIANAATALLNRDTEIRGLYNVAAVNGGAILTCNHFSPLDNSVVRKLTRTLRKKRISIISQPSNFAMTGLIGFLMNYADTIPLGDTPQYLMQTLPEIIKQRTDRNEFVLIYPEKEMWFNYRKPRPPLRGAYRFAAQLNVPVISCFVEMQDTDKPDAPGFRKVRYVLHILDVLFPDPQKSIRENSIDLCKKDYELKKQAYERVYQKELRYDFDPSDIAGWTGEL